MTRNGRGVARSLAILRFEQKALASVTAISADGVDRTNAVNAEEVRKRRKWLQGRVLSTAPDLHPLDAVINIVAVRLGHINAFSPLWKRTVSLGMPRYSKLRVRRI